MSCLFQSTTLIQPLAHLPINIFRSWYISPRSHKENSNMIRTSRPGWHDVSWVLSSRLRLLTHRLGSEIATSIVLSTFPALHLTLRCFLFDPEASNWDCPSSSSSPFLMPGCWLGRLPPRSSRSSPPPPCSLSKHIEASPWTWAPHPKENTQIPKPFVYQSTMWRVSSPCCSTLRSLIPPPYDDAVPLFFAPWS